MAQEVFALGRSALQRDVSIGGPPPRGAALVGAGSLETEALNHGALEVQGIRSVSAFDFDPKMIGTVYGSPAARDIASIHDSPETGVR